MEASVRPNERVARTSMLGAVLCTLVACVLLREVQRTVPREPALFLLNDSLGPLENFVIRSECGEIQLGSLAEGRSVRLAFRPRAGCKYVMKGETLLGDELLRLLELGRERRTDVVIVVGLDYVRADLQ